MSDISFTWIENEYEKISIGANYQVIGDEIEIDNIIAIWEWVSDDGTECSLPIPGTHPVYSDSEVKEMAYDKAGQDLYETICENKMIGSM